MKSFQRYNINSPLSTHDIQDKNFQSLSENANNDGIN